MNRQLASESVSHTSSAEHATVDSFHRLVLCEQLPDWSERADVADGSGAAVCAGSSQT
jgi:hypothetical protein